MMQNKSRNIISFSVFAFMFIAPVMAAVPSTYWNCTYGNAPYGDISVTYVNENAANKAEIFALTPQKYPIIYPGERVILQLSSKNCVEFTLVVKDSGGNEVARYSKEPYSPHACDVKDNWQYDFLTNFDFNMSKTPGIYTLDILDDKGVLLDTALIGSLDPSAQICSISRKAWCTIDGLVYEVTLSAPYPIATEAENPGKIGVTIHGSDSSIINEMFSRIITITGAYSDHNLANSGDLVCSIDTCVQNYSLSSHATEYTTLRVMQTVSEPTFQFSAINSETVSILNRSDIKMISMKIDGLFPILSAYMDYYTSVGDTEKYALCEKIYGRLESLRDSFTTSVWDLASGTLTTSEAYDLINFTETYQADIDFILDSIDSLRT